MKLKGILLQACMTVASLVCLSILVVNVHAKTLTTAVQFSPIDETSFGKRSPDFGRTALAFYDDFALRCDASRNSVEKSGVRRDFSALMRPVKKTNNNLEYKTI